MRCVSTRVLPEPAPARMSSGPSPCVTASRWGSLRPSSRASMRSSAAACGKTPEHTTARGGVRPPPVERQAQSVCLGVCAENGTSDRPPHRTLGTRRWGQPRRMGGKDALGPALASRRSSSWPPRRARPRRPRARTAATSSPPCLPPIAVPRCSAPSTPSARPAVSRSSRRARSSRAPRRATPTTWSRGASSSTSPPAARRSATAWRPPATSRVAATGSSARRSPGPSSRSTRPTASCAHGWPAPATARSSSTGASATSGSASPPA